MLEDMILFRRNRKIPWETGVTHKDEDYGQILASRQDDKKPKHSEPGVETRHRVSDQLAQEPRPQPQEAGKPLATPAGPK